MPRGVKATNEEVTVKAFPKPSARELITELEDLYLRVDGALAGRGLYYRALFAMPLAGGHIDRDTDLVVRIKEVILELKKIITKEE